MKSNVSNWHQSPSVSPNSSYYKLGRYNTQGINSKTQSRSRNQAIRIHGRNSSQEQLKGVSKFPKKISKPNPAYKRFKNITKRTSYKPKNVINLLSKTHSREASNSPIKRFTIVNSPKNKVILYNKSNSPTQSTNNLEKWKTAKKKNIRYPRASDTTPKKKDPRYYSRPTSKSRAIGPLSIRLSKKRSNKTLSINNQPNNIIRKEAPFKKINLKTRVDSSRNKRNLSQNQKNPMKMKRISYPNTMTKKSNNNVLMSRMSPTPKQVRNETQGEASPPLYLHQGFRDRNRQENESQISKSRSREYLKRRAR